MKVCTEDQILEMCINSPNANIHVNPPLNTPTINIPSAILSADQHITLTASETGGTGVYSYQWKVNGHNVGANLPTYVFNGNASTQAGSIDLVTVTVADLGVDLNATPVENPQTSSPTAITVDPVLTAPVITPSSSTISADQNVVLTSTTSNGGTGSYSYTWNDGATVLPCTTNVCTVLKNTLSTGVHSITVHIVDTGTSSNANPAENITSSAVTVNVDPVLTAPVITPSSSTISADQTVVLTSTTSNGGTGVYTYTWNDGATVLPCTTNVCTFERNSAIRGAEHNGAHSRYRNLIECKPCGEHNVIPGCGNGRPGT